MRTMRKTMILFALLLLFGGCARQLSTDSHNSRNSLDWSGTYEGVLPCADCEGIHTTLILNKDNTWEKKVKYEGKSETVHAYGGTFKWSRDGNGITLKSVTSRETPVNYRVGENRLVQLDLSGKVIEGALADRYILSKSTTMDTIDEIRSALQKAASANTKWKLSELNGRPVEQTGDKDYYIQLLNDGTVVAFAGCNSIAGSYELKEGNRIAFLQMRSTLKACMNMEAEEQLKKALEIADNYYVINDTLQLNRARMAPLAKFTAIK